MLKKIIYRSCGELCRTRSRFADCKFQVALSPGVKERSEVWFIYWAREARAQLISIVFALNSYFVDTGIVECFLGRVGTLFSTWLFFSRPSFFLCSEPFDCKEGGHSRWKSFSCSSSRSGTQNRREIRRISFLTIRLRLVSRCGGISAVLSSDDFAISWERKERKRE